MLLLHADSDGLAGGPRYITAQGGELLPCLWGKSGVGLGAVTRLTAKSWSTVRPGIKYPHASLPTAPTLPGAGFTVVISGGDTDVQSLNNLPTVHMGWTRASFCALEVIIVRIRT